MAIHARQLALEPDLQIIRRSRRPLLPGLEQARRSALAHHVHRIAPMGARVLINGIRYNPVPQDQGVITVFLNKRAYAVGQSQVHTRGSSHTSRCGPRLPSLPTQTAFAVGVYHLQVFLGTAPNAPS